MPTIEELDAKIGRAGKVASFALAGSMAGGMMIEALLWTLREAGALSEADIEALFERALAGSSAISHPAITPAIKALIASQMQEVFQNLARR